MHKLLFIFFIIFSVALADQSLDFTSWNNVLSKHITRGTLNQINLNLVDYNAIRNDTDFAAFLKQIETTNTTDFTREEFFAFYVNVYNAFAVNMIIKNSCKSDIFGNCGPIASIRNIGTLIHSVWDAPAGIVGGKTYSLDEIEDMLRHPPYGWLTDITLHSAIVCASISCPDLRMTAYGYPTINETFSQMNQSMYEFLNNTQKGMDVNQAKNTITLSHIFSWYQFDFTNQTKTLLSFLVDYVDPYNPHYDYIKTMNTTKPEDVKINFFGYDWDLNGLKTSIPCGSKARPCFPLWVLFIAIGCVIITVASIIIVLVNRRRNVIHY